ncbi:hypothetical protein P0D88_50905 [Paraburkholderia sp. RL18-103-BIB-C]|jgi:hypothetical protein|uniref:hypothetical protein n=1 Tax=unclassified Paraburkholderia TaxID=2615204 RepID=UPI0038BCACB1
MTAAARRPARNEPATSQCCGRQRSVIVPLCSVIVSLVLPKTATGVPHVPEVFGGHCPHARS